MARFAELPERDPRAGARKAALDVLGRVAPLVGRGRRVLRRPRLQILNLHHVFPDEEEGFRRLLGWLRETGHDLVPYGAGVAALVEGRLERPSVAVTFDDGLHSCVRAAAILEEFGTRGCFFVVTDMVGETDPERVRRFCAERIHMPPVAFLDWDDVDALARAGHEIGSHTHTHPVMSDLTPEGAAEELGASREALMRRMGAVRHFSWPRGRFAHFSADAAAAVFEAGFESCASAERGAHPPVHVPVPARGVCLRRDHAIAAWPLAHHRWFVGAAAAGMSQEHNGWPAAWQTRWGAPHPDGA